MSRGSGLLDSIVQRALRYAASLDRGRLVTAGALALLCGLVAIRAWVFVIRGAHFDSDQAVLGIMGNDLAEGRAFPWFTYGRQYMLAVGAWLCAPLFFLFGTSVTLLKLPLALLNFVLIGLLWIGLRRSERMTPWATAVSILPIALPGVAASSRMVEQGGGNIEPFVFLSLAFLLRSRPIWLGVTFGIASLNREFTLIGLIALVLMDVVNGRLATRWRAQLLTIGLVLAVNFAGHAIATISPNYFGPVVELGSFSRSNVTGLFGYQLPRLFGAASIPLDAYGIHSKLSVGHGWLWGVLVAWVAIAVVVTLRAWFVDRKSPNLDGMAAYFLLIAGGQGLAFILFCHGSYNPMLLRYVLVMSLGLVSLVAIGMQQRLLVPLTVALVFLFTAANARDHFGLLREYARHRPRDSHARLARALVKRGIQYAQADDYWVAYHVSFLTRERVIIDAPHDQRIDRYRNLVAAHRDELYLIKEKCRGGEQIERWQVCKARRQKKRASTGR